MGVVHMYNDSALSAAALSAAFTAATFTTAAKPSTAKPAAAEPAAALSAPLATPLTTSALAAASGAAYCAGCLGDDGNDSVRSWDSRMRGQRRMPVHDPRRRRNVLQSAAGLHPLHVDPHAS